LVLLLGSRLRAQNAPDPLQGEFIGQPLYLRGWWMENNLEFDSSGQVIGKAHQGPFTLSGIDVTSLTVRGTELVIRGHRVALVANADGRLERRKIYTTTKIVPSLRHHDFVADVEMQLLLHADSEGGFNSALKSIFVNGLMELGSAVPPYWTCYAQTYFAQDQVNAEAEKSVADCARRRSLSGGRGADGNMPSDFTPPLILSTVKPTFPPIAADAFVGGVSRVRFTVSRNGIPVGFQVLRAVGAGMDEETLQAVSQYRFKPATIDGKPVAADLDVGVEYEVQR
jgi:TonB family protein